MQEMDRRIALLRLLLADISGRERETSEAITQLRKQLTRVVDFTVQYNGSVAGALSSLAEVEERLTQQEDMLRHLRMLRERASGELQALLVTREVSDARARLAALAAQRRTLMDAGDAATAVEDARDRERRLAEIDAEIAELQAQIQAASDAAARALTSGGSGDPPQQHTGTVK